MDKKHNAASITEVPDRDIYLSILQRQLLQNAFSLLRVGGTLVYSTCSLKQEQNEDNVFWYGRFMHFHRQFIPEPISLLSQASWDLSWRFSFGHRIRYWTIWRSSTQIGEITMHALWDMLELTRHLNPTHVFNLKSSSSDPLFMTAVAVLTGDTKTVETIITDCVNDQSHLISVSRSVCRLVSNLPKVPAVASRLGKGMLRLDRHCGTSGQFVSRITKVTHDPTGSRIEEHESSSNNCGRV